MEPKRPSDPDYLGKWKITSRLGEGGFGIVYLASSGVHSAAIKVIKEEFLEDQGAREKIIHEAQVLGKLDDPNIGKIVDSGLDEPVPWLATEYVNGPTLHEKVLLEKPLEELAWFNLASDLFHALTTSHAAGVIHKDIKPSNIILGESGTKLIDFGISHLSGKTKLGTVGDFEGTHPFSAPENYITGKNVPQMDVFSAAATLAFAAKGSSVWAGESLRQIMGSIMYAEPNLDGMTDLQKDFLLPLFEKDTSVRPTAREALHKANEYLEYLVAKVGGARPNPIRVPTLPGKGHKRVILTSIGFAGALALAAIFLFANSPGTTPAKANLGLSTPTLNISKSVPSHTATPPAVASSSTAISQDNPEIQRNLDLSKSYYDAKDFVNALKYSKVAANLGSAHGIYDVGFILEAQGKVDEAIPWYERAANLKYTDAYLNLGNLYEKKKNFVESVGWYKLGIAAGNAASMDNLALYYSHNNQSILAEKLWLRAIALGDLHATFNLALAYDEEGKTQKAISLYKKASDAGYIDATINLGVLYEHDADWVNAKKYYLVAALKGDPYGMFDYGLMLHDHFGNPTEACNWYLKATQAKNADTSILKTARVALKQSCGIVDTSATSATASPHPTTKSTQASENNQLRFAYPDAPNVITGSIYGRPFENNNMQWEIATSQPGSMSPVDFNGIEFKASGTTMPWISTPYKLITTQYGVDALVEELLLEILTKNPNFCPEFRLVKEVNQQVVSIWNKSAPVCTTPYASPSTTN